MNKTVSEAKQFALETAEIAKYAQEKGILVGVSPTYLGLDTVKQLNPNLIVSAQNVHFQESGAFTGEISIPMLQELGISWCLIGHSERRQYDNETNEKCNKKIHALTKQGMTAVYCVGETLEEFEKGLTKAVVKEQLISGLANLSEEELLHVVIAYEPVWSIGTGKNASKEIAQDVCHFIRKVIKDMLPSVAEEMLILYGGSVKPENIKEYLTEKDIDGALVGGASLKVDSFTTMIKNLVD